MTASNQRVMTYLLQAPILRHLSLIWALVLTGHSGAQENKITDPFAADEKSATRLAESFPAFRVHPAPDGKAYFPKGKESYYTYYLAAMKEPSLQAAEAKADDFHFRFTWLRSFHDPVSIRVWSHQSQIQCHYIALGGKSQDSPGTPKDEETLAVSEEQLQTLQALASAPDFWTPLNKQEDMLNEGGIDGARWVFEWKDAQGYRLQNIWSPPGNTSETYRDSFGDKAKHRNFTIYTKIGTFLLKLCHHLPTADAIY
jgi:hypothetical protein